MASSAHNPLPSGQRVSYILSPALIWASNVLPSNIGRSLIVHSLAYHFDLLDLPPPLHSPDVDPWVYSEDEEVKDDHRTLANLLAGPGQDGECEVDSFELVTPEEHCNDRLVNLRKDSVQSKSNKAHVIIPEPVTEEALKAYHSCTYVDVLLADKKNQRAIDDEACGLVDDCYRFPELAEHVRFISGASISAAKVLARDEADVAINWDGGRHHAHKSRAAGFCYVNDVVLAILELKRPRKIILQEEGKSDVIDDPVDDQCLSSYQTPRLGFGARPEDILRAHGISGTKREPHPGQQHPKKRRTVMTRLERIIYLDLDLHWGDGVEEAFRGSPSVLTLSIHNQAPGFYPVAPGTLTDTDDSEGEEKWEELTSGGAHTLRLPLQPDAGPETWARVWASCVAPVIASYEPEAIVVQCGLDSLAGDPMRQWNLDLKTLLLSVEHVLNYVKYHKGVKLLLLGGGGYNSPNAARAWAAITAMALERFRLPESERENTSQLSTLKDYRESFISVEAADGPRQTDTNPAHLLNLQSPIPDTSPDWPRYGAAATLDVPSGDVPDVRNDESYLARIERHFASKIEVLQEEKWARERKKRKEEERGS